MSRRGVCLGICLFAAALGCCAPTACGAEAAAPFVAGFDRFARHGDITPRLGGRLLLTELNCTACHAADDQRLAPKLGPKLDGVGNRLERSWLRKYLAAPQRVKPGTTMPDVLNQLPHAERPGAIEALVAFLATQQQPFPVLRASGRVPVPHQFWNRGDVAEGRRLYHRVGCVACHEPDVEYEAAPREASQLDKLLKQLDPEELAEMGLAGAARPVNSIPHGDLPAKYTHRALTFFLLDPAAIRPAGRMPSLKLSPIEASHIAAYLLREKAAASRAADETSGDDASAGGDHAALVETGRRLFRELRCGGCHPAQGGEKPAPARSLADLSPGAEPSCIGRAGGGLPHYTLDETQRTSIREALDTLRSSKSSGPPADQQLDFQLLQLNCYGCHERDGRGGVGRRRQAYFETVDHIDLGDEGRLPPPLVGVGRKLTVAWLKKVLEGKGDVRPHLLARMPLFPPDAVARLPNLLAKADGPSQASPTDVFGDLRDATTLAEAGRTLLDTGCVQCHPMRGDNLAGVVGVDLAGTAGRIRPQWFHDFLLDPVRLKPRTRMPTFFPKGKSANQEVLDGDVERQIAAIWTYLRDIDRLELPDKLVQQRSQNFELVPTDRPILLRTFMEKAGLHAVAVGFPARVHFAFDAEQVRPALAWRGRFLDAHGTWFVRFAPLAKPLGDHAVALPAGPPLALLDDAQQPWPEAAGGNGETVAGGGGDYRFRGYRLDRAGVPTFLYRVDRFDVEDRLEPTEGNGLRRTLHVESRDSRNASGKDDQPEKSSRLWFRAAVGPTLRRKSPTACTDPQGLTTVVSSDAAESGRLRVGQSAAGSNGPSDWILPVILSGGQATINVEYQW